jgi:hypothetical protein
MAERTKTSISNLALREIGTYRIEDFDTEDSAEAEILRDVWDDVLRACLGRHEWRFAMKQAELQQGDTPVARYEYSYRLPADYVRLSVVSDRDLMDPITDWDVIYTTGEAVPTVITNAASCFVEYVGEVQDPNAWAPHFVEYFVAVLASRIAAPLKSTIERQRLIEYAERSALPMARSADSTLQPPKRPPLGSWIRSMHGGGSGSMGGRTSSGGSSSTSTEIEEDYWTGIEW